MKSHEKFSDKLFYKTILEILYHRFLAPAVTVGETEEAMDSAYTFVRK